MTGWNVEFSRNKLLHWNSITHQIAHTNKKKSSLKLIDFVIKCFRYLFDPKSRASHAIAGLTYVAKKISPSDWDSFNRYVQQFKIHVVDKHNRKLPTFIKPLSTINLDQAMQKRWEKIVNEAELNTSPKQREAILSYPQQGVAAFNPAVVIPFLELATKTTNSKLLNDLDRTIATWITSHTPLEKLNWFIEIACKYQLKKTLAMLHQSSYITEGYSSTDLTSFSYLEIHARLILRYQSQLSSFKASLDNFFAGLTEFNVIDLSVRDLHFKDYIRLARECQLSHLLHICIELFESQCKSMGTNNLLEDSFLHVPHTFESHDYAQATALGLDETAKKIYDLVLARAFAYECVQQDPKKVLQGISPENRRLIDLLLKKSSQKEQRLTFLKSLIKVFSKKYDWEVMYRYLEAAFEESSETCNRLITILIIPNAKEFFQDQPYPPYLANFFSSDPYIPQIPYPQFMDIDEIIDLYKHLKSFGERLASNQLTHYLEKWALGFIYHLYNSSFDHLSNLKKKSLKEFIYSLDYTKLVDEEQEDNSNHLDVTGIICFFYNKLVPGIEAQPKEHKEKKLEDRQQKNKTALFAKNEKTNFIIKMPSRNLYLEQSIVCEKSSFLNRIAEDRSQPKMMIQLHRNQPMQEVYAKKKLARLYDVHLHFKQEQALEHLMLYLYNKEFELNYSSAQHVLQLAHRYDVQKKLPLIVKWVDHVQLALKRKLYNCGDPEDRECLKRLLEAASLHQLTPIKHRIGDYIFNELLDKNTPKLGHALMGKKESLELLELLNKHGYERPHELEQRFRLAFPSDSDSNYEIRL